MEIIDKILYPEYDNAHSFYGKATIKKYYENNILQKIELYSYKTLVLTIANNKYNLNYEIKEKLLFSNTTLRHIKECLLQYFWIHNNERLTAKLTKQNIINYNNTEWYKIDAQKF